MAAEDREEIGALLRAAATGVKVVAKACADVRRTMIRLLADTEQG
jgi:hypothetical protein